VRRGELAALLDARLGLPSELAARLDVHRVPATLVGRFLGERRLAALAGPGDSVLCFGNLPPLFSLRGRVHLFVQNRFLLSPRDISEFPPGVRLRIAMERRWLRARVGGVERIVVQSASMARELKAALGRDASVLPFAPSSVSHERAAPPVERFFDYVYVASGEPHKNHGRLLEAWALLAEEGIMPSLGLTLDPVADPALCDRVQRLAGAHGLRVALVGPTDAQGLDELYRSARALIYPSVFESLGLPLVEARRRGLPILAAERDYVRDVAEPEQTFDPESSVSIARAVKRHLGRRSGLQPVLTPDQFLEALLST